MAPVMPSLEGSGTLSVKKKWKALNYWMSFRLKPKNPDIKDPDISKVDIKSTIKTTL